MSKTLQAGLAYGIFKCSDTRRPHQIIARFKEALENVKALHEETGIPPQTEFSVFDIRSGMAHLISADGAKAMAEHIVHLEVQGANYMIRSCLPGAPNETAARNLADTLNMLYGGTELFDAENQFAQANPGHSSLVMDVFFRAENGQYVSQLALDLAETGRGK